MEKTVEKTAMPVVAGILAIASGGFKLLSIVGMIMAIFLIVTPVDSYGIHPLVILLALCIPLTILGVVAIIGGISALQRKRFGLAVAGSVASFLPFSFLGLASIILIALSRKEFD